VLDVNSIARLMWSGISVAVSTTDRVGDISLSSRDRPREARATGHGPVGRCMRVSMRQIRLFEELGSSSIITRKLRSAYAMMAVWRTR
jgi:hypothetical protein